VERVLADIDADHGDRTAKLLSHRRAHFIECLLPAYLLTGQEHGRTIPLAVLVPSRHLAGHRLRPRVRHYELCSKVWISSHKRSRQLCARQIDSWKDLVGSRN